jgi:hypothetical protein
MITLGLDPHPGSHTVVALDDNGVSMGHLTVSNIEEGLVRLHEFSGEFAFRRWAIEGAGNHFISLFVGQLLSRGETVCSIPPALTSQYRARRGRKKNDIVDAEKVARALMANPQFAGLEGGRTAKGASGVNTNTAPPFGTTQGKPEVPVLSRPNQQPEHVLLSPAKRADQRKPAVVPERHQHRTSNRRADRACHSGRQHRPNSLAGTP